MLIVNSSFYCGYGVVFKYDVRDNNEPSTDRVERLFLFKKSEVLRVKNKVDFLKPLFFRNNMVDTNHHHPDI